MTCLIYFKKYNFIEFMIQSKRINLSNQKKKKKILLIQISESKNPQNFLFVWLTIWENLIFFVYI